MTRQWCRIGGIAFLLSAACVPRGPVEPAKAPLSDLATEAATPARAASMRMVEAGRAELTRNRFEKAAAHLSRAVEVDATNPFAYFYLGLARYDVANNAQAAELFRKAGDLFGDRPNWRAESYAYRGECLERLSRTDLAIRSYERALEFDNGNRRAVDGLGRLRR